MGELLVGINVEQMEERGAMNGVWRLQMFVTICLFPDVLPRVDANLD
jgi:hypothetical protein